MIPTPFLHIFLPQTVKVCFLTASELHFGSSTKDYGDRVFGWWVENCKRICIFQSACSNQNTYKPTHIRLNMSKRSFHTHQIHQTSVLKTRLMTHGPHVAVLRYKIQQNQCQADRCGPNQQIPWWLTILDLSFGMGFEDMIWLCVIHLCLI